MKEKDNEKKSGKGKKGLVIVLILILVAGAGAGGYFFFKKNSSPNMNQMAVNTQGMQNAGMMMVDESAFELGELTVNLCDKDDKRYAKVKIFVGYPKKNKKLAKELEEKKSILRDMINLELMAKKSSELDVAGVQKVKKELTAKLNTALTKGQIVNVYFDNIIVQ